MVFGRRNRIWKHILLSKIEDQMNREFKPNIGIALLFTSLALLGTNASAVTFNVSNADEFQLR